MKCANIDIRRLVRGDKRVWDDFVERFSAVIYSAVLKVLRKHIKEIHEWDVKELVQDVFVRLIKDNYHLLRSYNPSRSSLVTWLTIVTRSTVIDFLRRRKPQTEPLFDETIASKGATSSRESINIPPNLLSSRQTLILQLFFDKGMDAQDIAQLLNIDDQTVRSTKHKALKKLRKFFGKA